ncbi:hypothetical protein M918_19520 [Clostridium sp. BL8]|uniref:hypothetical protein n=1 Tax=Clostridium sp. BL8 TaxID=1354301 RepID=UPI00038A4343|nr:hypothetical protein [Clostridium sp. BL8]EQB89698.1 hypothetical protein M918_19520 [Clostridium sp. BL8]
MISLETSIYSFQGKLLENYEYLLLRNAIEAHDGQVWISAQGESFGIYVTLPTNP